MSETDSTCLASLTFFLRERFFRQAIHTAEEYLEICNNDPVVKCFRAYGKLMEGRTQEAIRELGMIKDMSSVSICAPIALIYAHKQCKTCDHEAVSELKSHVNTIRRTAGEQALFYGGLFLWLMGRNDKANDYIDKILYRKSFKKGLILKGWLDMSSEDEFQRNKAIRHLTAGIDDGNDVFGLMGKVKYLLDKQNFSRSIEIVNQILMSHQDFLPGLLMKMRLFLALQDWDQALEMVNRILQQDGRNCMAIQVQAIHAIAKDGDVTNAKLHLQALLNAAEISEPCSPSLQVQITQPISRLCGGNTEILQLLIPFAERAYAKAPADANIANEIGYLLTLQDKAKEAAHWYSTALNVDASSMPALAGLIRCQLMDGQLEDAASPLELLREIQPTGQSAKEYIGAHSQRIGPLWTVLQEVALLQALLAHKRGEGVDVVSPILKEATELHFLALQGRPMGPEYFHLLHPNFIFQVVNLNLSYIQEKPMTAGRPLPFGLSQSIMVLDPVVRMTPGLLPGAYHMAHVRYLAGDSASAQRFLDVCLERDPTMAEFHLLQAKMHLHDRNYQRCIQSLETTLSHNFQVRELPQYHLIKARALRSTGNLAGAVQTLRTAMSLPGMRKVASDRKASVSGSNKVAVYLELAEALRLNGEQCEATMAMQDAISTFAGTPEEIHVTMANVDLALAKDDTDTALATLWSIAANQRHYLEAREKIAHIYLHHQRNKKLYICCYRDIRDAVPGPQSSILLGDAYMNIQEPEKAIEVYQEAISKTVGDATLSRKMGQAYVKAHQYNQALSHYERALKLGGQSYLLMDYAELLIKLRNHSKAHSVLMSSMSCEDGASLSALICNVKCLLLLVKTHQDDEGSVKDTLEKVHSLQLKILRRVQMEQPEMYTEQKGVMASACCLLARLYHRKRDFDKAQEHYSESITYSNGSHKFILELAQLYLENGRLVEAEAQCHVILRGQEKHPEARMICADIVFRRDDYDAAIDIYLNLIADFPDNYIFLAKYIRMLRKLGRLQDALPMFKTVESFNHRVTTEPGYCYCKGLFLWHVCRVSEALYQLNKARRDMQWGELALELMIRICLNPDNETIGGELFEDQQKETESSPMDNKKQSDTGVCTAHNLVMEFRPRTPQGQDKVTLLTNLCLMATREPTQVGKALQVFTDMASSKANNEAYLLAMAQAFMLLKQTPRARNQLKRLKQVEWREELAEDLEAAWLLLADMYIKTSKYDIAQELLRRCLKYNKSCSRAYEYLGFMSEKEMSYRDASELYNQAWMFSNRANPSMGFRLAFNYLKSKRYTDAIDVCHKVLTEHPDYPLIRTEVLERAQSALRP